VLWLSAALAAIGFSLASTVRGEAERTSTAVDSLRSYYMAQGAIQRCLLELLWSITYPNQRVVPKGSTVLNYRFPSGDVMVELIPEASKLNINTVPPEQLMRLMLALGVAPGKAGELVEAIDDWRRPGGGGGFDSYYLSLTPSFRSPHASFQEIEELLLVRGVTPDIFYGTYVPAGEAEPGAGEAAEPGVRRLLPRGGLMDCLSVYGSKDRVDANTASPAVLAAVGLNPYAISALLERRRMGAMSMQELMEFMGSIGADASPLRVEGNSMITLRATARLRLPNGQLSDLKRSVSAVVKYMPPGTGVAVHVVRWYDTAWSN
jgi:general secretion pathway protein K